MDLGGAQHWRSFAGEDTITVNTSLGQVQANRPDVSLTDVQPIIRYRVSNVTNIGLAPNWRYNWETEQLSLPLGMGGDLTNGPKGKAPTFMIRALRDADGANLDRIQIIKGWLDKKGKVHERIYDAAVSDARKIGSDGHCKTPVGNTVDVKDASYTNTIGDPLLAAHWTDPAFDPTQRAFYYARVIEIPTPRWTAYDAKKYAVKMPPEVPMVTQERAYTSPIWYNP